MTSVLSSGREQWTIEQVPSINCIEPAEWSAVARGYGLYLSHPWLAAVEDIESDDATVSYLAVRRQGTLCAAMPIYLRSRPSPDDFYDPVSQFIRPVFPDDFPKTRGEWYPLVLGGNAAAYWNDLLIHPELNPQDRQLALDELLAAFHRTRGDGAAALMWSTPEATDAIRSRSGDTVRTIFGGAQATIDVNWPSFEAYTSWLPKHPRSTVRREVSRFAEWEARRISPELTECCDQLAPLVADLQRRYGHQSDESRIRAQLRAQAKHVGDHAVIFACELSGKIVAFALTYLWENELFVRTVGFDYERTAGTFAYFNLAYYQPISFAIANNIRRVHLGMGTYSAKVARGARLTPSWSAVFPSAMASDLTSKALDHLEATGVSRWEEAHGVTLHD